MLRLKLRTQAVDHKRRQYSWSNDLAENNLRQETEKRKNKPSLMPSTLLNSGYGKTKLSFRLYFICLVSFYFLPKSTVIKV